MLDFAKYLKKPDTNPEILVKDGILKAYDSGNNEEYLHILLYPPKNKLQSSLFRATNTGLQIDNSQKFRRA